MSEEEDEEEESMDLVEQSIFNTEQYVEIQRKNRETLEKTNPKDRLEYAKEMLLCFQVLAMSVKGWLNWLSNYNTINELSLEEMTEIYPEIRKVVLKFIDIDIEITKKKIGEAKVKHQIKKKPTANNKKYIS